MADPRGEPGGQAPPLFLDQTKAQGAEKLFWENRAPSFSHDLDDRPIPPPPLSGGLDPPLQSTIFLRPFFCWEIS